MQKESFDQVFRRRLGSLVAKNGADGKMSANAFAAKCGLTSSRRVSDWLEGGTMMPSADNLRRISEAFGVSVDWLLGFNVPMMRGSSTGKADLQLELALHVEHALAVRARGKPYAFHLATQIIDGGELLKAAIYAQVQLVEDAWRHASAYTRSGVALLQHSLGQADSPKKRTYPFIEHLTFQAAIFEEVLHRESKVFRSGSKFPHRKNNRPLLVLLRSVGPASVRNDRNR